ncbi:type II toxin-antitoxin system VapC family toxin [Aphanothece sacrum]|uniref:PIN domain protein n=1 Tax=Aphanothece sacrum FPU1 TaxID=1920663 RepID=A0A401IDE6_APHSA|nr:PIN domain-containing protein [Aphanothece sacrum]GBF79272.1 PIN domain protein [Aphanothece sacrum FPU1]GBF86775.1 PIN domain protein [Aphanothece sacrum FPU3]
MNVLIDTNVIIDIALERQPHFVDSDRVLSLAEQNQIKGYISASTFGDLYYIINRNKGRIVTLDFISKVCQCCQVATVDAMVIDMALNANFNDFEDGIQYSCAMVNQIEIIVTRNPQDFPVTTSLILTPSQLIEQYLL